jgi:hypothetical protein
LTLIKAQAGESALKANSPFSNLKLFHFKLQTPTLKPKLLSNCLGQGAGKTTDILSASFHDGNGYIWQAILT